MKRTAIGFMALRWLSGPCIKVTESARRYTKRGCGFVGLLNLRGWYLVGMLMGYESHAQDMDVIEYGEKVIAREIKDPTVTMQMNRGFRPVRVITDYVDESAAGNAGVLLVWDNPHFDPDLAR